jgi:hypothetical protein
MVSFEYPLSLVIIEYVWRSKIHFLNHINRFLIFCSGRFLVKQIPQFLHLNLCLPFLKPQFITSKLPQLQHRFFLIFSYNKKVL